MALFDSLHDLGRKAARILRPWQHGFVFAQQMLIEFRLENFPASLRLRAHFAIRRPEAENDAGDCRVEQRHPETVFFPAQFFREVSNLARVRKLPGPGWRRLFGDAHIRSHSPPRPAASTSDSTRNLKSRTLHEPEAYRFSGLQRSATRWADPKT